MSEDIKETWDNPTVAAKRGMQTLQEALIAALIVSLAAPLIGAVQSATSWVEWLSSWEAWTWGMFQAALVAVLTALISWARRRFVNPAEGPSTAPMDPYGDDTAG